MQKVLLLGRDEADLEEHEILALRSRLGFRVSYERIEAGNAQELIAGSINSETKAIVLPPRPFLEEALRLAKEAKIAGMGVTVYVFSRLNHGECLCKLTPTGELVFAEDSPPKLPKPKLCLV